MAGEEAFGVRCAVGREDWWISVVFLLACWLRLLNFLMSDIFRKLSFHYNLIQHKFLQSTISS